MNPVLEYLSARGFGDRYIDLSTSSATVAEAAAALHCAPAQIAKTLSFLVEDQPVLILAAGDAKVDNHKYKGFFHCKAMMCPRERLEELVGFAAGGVCPFACKDGVKVYLDASLQRFSIIYPAGGNSHSAVKLSVAELQTLTGCSAFIDVCKLPTAAAGVAP